MTEVTIIIYNYLTAVIVIVETAVIFRSFIQTKIIPLSRKFTIRNFCLNIYSEYDLSELMCSSIIKSIYIYIYKSI